MVMPMKPRVKIKCLNCKKIFEVIERIADERKFCGRLCQVSGKFNPNYGKHPVAWNKGIPHSEETRKKISLAAMGRKGLCGSKNGNWKRGYWKTDKGYIGMMHNGKRMLQHRVIWEKINGKIPEGYIIHHINNNPLDNRIENLKVMTLSEHTTLHQKGNTYWLGKKHSEKTKRKMSKSRKNREYNSKDTITAN